MKMTSETCGMITIMSRHRAPEPPVIRPVTVVKAVIGSLVGGVLLGVLSPLGPLVLWAVGL